MASRTLLGLAILAALALAPAVRAAPAEVRSCFDTVRFEAPPRQPVVNDFNMVQTLIDMGLIGRNLNRPEFRRSF